MDHAVADAYGVWVKKSMYGRAYFGNERTTFIIDAYGRVADVLRKVKPAEHDKLVLDACAPARRVGRRTRSAALAFVLGRIG